MLWPRTPPGRRCFCCCMCFVCCFVFSDTVFGVELSFPLRSAFLALPLVGEGKERFAGLQSMLEPWREFLSLQNPETPHITLYFWKSLMEIEYKPVHEKARWIAARHRSFSLTLTGVETFGDHGRERVLFLKPAFSPELASIKKDCPWPNLQEFQPHVTLARIRHPERFSIHKKSIMKVLDGGFDVVFDRVGLYAEIDGRKQTLIEDFPLSLPAPSSPR